MDAWESAKEYFEAEIDAGTLEEADCPEAEESEAPLTFHEKIKDEVLGQFINMQGKIDSRFRKKYVQLENYIDEMIEEEMDNTMEMEANPDYAENLGELEGDL